MKVQGARAGLDCVPVEARRVPDFFHKVLSWAVADPGEICIGEQTQGVIFLDHCLCSMEVDLGRTQVQRLVSLPSAHLVLPAGGHERSRVEDYTKVEDYWKLLQKKDAKETPENLEKL